MTERHYFTIEKGIPVPPKRGAAKSGLSATLRQMDAGDSVLLPTDGKHYPAGNTLHKLHNEGFRFTRRKVEGGFRIWRIE